MALHHAVTPMSQQMVWRPIPGYPGYFASDAGLIGSAKKNRRPSPGCPYFILRPFAQDGYPRVHLSIDGKTRGRFVHQLVCLAFNGEPPEKGMLVAHDDGNRNNNKPGNLLWKTGVGNAADRGRQALRPGRDWRRGNRLIPLSTKLALLRDYDTLPLNIAQLARRYAVDRHSIYKIVENRQKYERAPDSAVDARLMVQVLQEIEDLTRGHDNATVTNLRERMRRIRDRAMVALATQVPALHLTQRT